jgi:hypothetical protein
MYDPASYFTDKGEIIGTTVDLSLREGMFDQNHCMIGIYK